MSRPPALLVVGHGTRSAAGVAEFTDLVSRVQALAEVDVAGGFIELAPPPVTEAVAGLVALGHSRVIAVPLVLVAAGHSKGDIPAAMVRETLRHPGLTYGYGRPLGTHPTVLQQLTERLDTLVSIDERPDTAVLLVGRGTTDPDANAEVAKAARLLWEGRGLQFVEAAFVSLADPSVDLGLERCLRLGATRIVVLPFFLFPGVLPDRVVTQSTTWASKHPGVGVVVGGLIGASDPLARLVLERYAEAAAGLAAMNCDSCLYRIALPGFESRVGSPQRPHDHPNDRADHNHHHGTDHAH